MAKQLFADQVESNEKATDPSIAIEKRMDGFELVMADGDSNELGNMNGFVVPECFQISEQVGKLIMMWRHEDGICGRCPTDPVLAHPEFAGSLFFPPRSLHENSVGLAEQTI